MLVIHFRIPISFVSLKRALYKEFDVSISVCKLRIILEVLSEQGLISLEYRDGENSADIKMLPTSGKINIDDSPLLRAIRS